MTTMRDVAAHAGVSAKTVSRVLNHDRYVTEGVRERVAAAVAELHYVPNMLAVSFRTGRDGAIGVAVPDISDPFFASIIQAVEREARSRQAAVIVTSLGYDPDYEREAIEALLKRQVVGLIACPVGPDQSYLRPWQDRTAMVFVDRSPRNLTADSVIEDDRGGAHAAVEHLLGHDHRRVAFLGDAGRTTTTALRLQGYAEALTEAGVARDEDLVYLGDTDPDGIDKALEALMNLADPPTALFSSNARCTVNVVPAVQRTGWDVALVSFGDFPMAPSLNPSVTVVDQNPEAVGRIAVERLFLRIDEPGKRLRRRTVLPVSLVERQSCRARVTR
jgi:LacI family transcriptional regulator